MKKLYVSGSDCFGTINASGMHMLTTGLVSAFDPSVKGLLLSFTTYADGNDLEAAPGTVVLEQNVVNEEPYTVKLAQYIRIGSVVVVTLDNTATADIGDTMNTICNYWEEIQMSDGVGPGHIAWGISRVQKTDFSDPAGDVAALTGALIYVYETAKQLRNSPNLNQGPIVGIDDSPLANALTPNRLVAHRATMIGGASKPGK